MAYETYRITDAAGVGKFLAVVQDAAAGDVKKPTGANAGKFVGVTQEDALTQNKGVRVKTDGRTFGTAAGAITVGDYVNIAGATGKFQSCQATVAAVLQNPAAIVYVVGIARTAAGADGDLFEFEIQPVPVAQAVS